MKSANTLPQAAAVKAVLIAGLFWSSPGISQDATSVDSAPATGIPGAATIISREVVVTQRETLADVAERELGQRGLASLLADVNELPIDVELSPGSTLQIPIQVPDRGESVTIIFAKGDVTVNGAGVDENRPVAPGDLIETGFDGFISLEFANGSAVNVQPETSVTVQELRCLEADALCIIGIETTNGEVISDVEGRDGQALEYRVTTPVASAAVRGTDFSVAADSSELRIAVVEGGVNVSAVGSNVGLDEGFGSVTAEGEPPGQPIALLPPPAFRTVPNRFVAGQSVSWWDIRAVERYRASIATDSIGRETVSNVETSQSSLDIADLGTIATGDYFLSVHGIDENGLPGFSASKRIIVAAVDDTLTAPAIDATRNGNDTLVSVVDPDPDARGYEIQLSSTEDFNDPLSVDVGPNGSAVFRFESDTIFARARRLEDPTTVSAFSALTEAR